jgi:hypothetical protein
VSLAAGTIAAKSDLALARVVASSFRRFHPDVPFFVLLTDEVSGYFDPAAEPFELLTLDDLSLGDPGFRFAHSRQELTYAATPYLLQHLLDRGAARAVFLKQESLVTAPLGDPLGRLDRHAIVLTPHLHEPLEGDSAVDRELDVLRAGVYNVGFIGVSDTAEARRFLLWWQDRLRGRCRYAPEDGLHFEQRWLDLAPVFFEGVHVLRDSGFNVGHWSLPERTLTVVGDEVSVDGKTCAFVRFSGFDRDRPALVTRYSPRLRVDELGSGARLFEGYAEQLDAAGHAESSGWPYAYGRFDNGARVPAIARTLYVELGEKARVFGDPFRTSGPQSFSSWLKEPHPPGPRPRSRPRSVLEKLGWRPNAHPISRLWTAVWERRDDLRLAFPDPWRSDHRAFVAWAQGPGAAEHAIDDPFRCR